MLISYAKRLLSAKPTREAALCFRSAFCHCLVKLVNTLVDLGTGLCGNVAGLLLALLVFSSSFLLALLELSLSISLALLDFLLGVMCLKVCQSLYLFAVYQLYSQLNQTCHRLHARRLRLSCQPPLREVLPGLRHLGSWPRPCEHQLRFKLVSVS